MGDFIDRRWRMDHSVGWLSASEHLPANDLGEEILCSVPVLVWAPRHMRYATVGWYNWLYERWEHSGGWLEDVTHWCGFPDTPEN